MLVNMIDLSDQHDRGAVKQPAHYDGAGNVFPVGADKLDQGQPQEKIPQRHKNKITVRPLVLIVEIDPVTRADRLCLLSGNKLFFTQSAASFVNSFLNNLINLMI